MSSAVLDNPPVRVLLTVPQAAAALGVSRSLTYELLGDGRLPSVKIGWRRADRWGLVLKRADLMRGVLAEGPLPLAELGGTTLDDGLDYLLDRGEAAILPDGSVALTDGAAR
jgi:excisionase family DNA binding protein